MKIIIANKYWYPRDGTTTHVFDLVELLESHGHTVIPFAMEHPDNVPTPYVKFFVSQKNFASPKNFFEKVFLFGQMIYSLEAKKKFTTLVKQERPDIVHIHNIYHHISPSILDVCAKMQIPVVQTVHDYKLVCPNYKLFAHGRIDEGCLKGNYFHDAWNRSVKGSIVSGIADALEMFVHRTLGSYRMHVGYWIVPSKIVAEKLIAGGFPAEKIKILSHFFNMRMCSERRHAKKNIIMCAGRLSEEKGFDVAIKALRDIKGVTLTIIGQGPMRMSLERLAEECGVRDRVEFTGMLSREEVLGRMASAKLTLVPSLWHEPFGYVALESLAVGTSVVAARSGALPEIIGPVSQELLVQTGDEKALVDKVNELLADENRLSDLAKKGREYALSQFDPVGYYEELIELYTCIQNNVNTKSVQP